MLAVDTVLQNRYRIIRQLGQGGMGAVYEAVDDRLGKTIAIKEVLLELANTSNEKQKELLKIAFRREADSLVKARHQAVPDVTDYFYELDRQFLVMEYIEGDDLAKMLQTRQKPFTLEEVMPWLDQLLEALDYLHNLTPPIIHRDIKPQNLKLNVWKKIKLLDFGIAKSTDKSSTITHQTFIGATLNYSPIEQILRVIDPTFREFIILKHQENARRVLAQNTDARCDIFALGATFYHLLTNYPPIDITKRTLETWEEKGDPLPSPVGLNPTLPPTVSDWLMKAMKIERDDRFSSATEMRKALHEAIAEDKLQKERITGEQVPIDAKTEKFVFQTEENRNQATGGVPLATQPSHPEIAKIPFPDTQSPIRKPATQAPHSQESFATQASENVTRPRENTVSQFTDGLQNRNRSAPGFIGDETGSGRNLKLLLLIPVFAIGLLLIGGIGGLAWYYNSGTDEPDKPVANVQTSPSPDSSPDSLRTAESSSEESNQTVNEEEALPTETKTENVKSTPQPLSTPQTTSRQTPVPTPVQRQTPRPTPVRKQTPRPTPVRKQTPRPTPRKTQNSDCIYTDDCK